MRPWTPKGGGLSDYLRDQAWALSVAVGGIPPNRVERETLDMDRHAGQSSRLSLGCQGGMFQPVSTEEIVSSTASLITVLASIAIGLVFIASVVRLGQQRS
jgi:hypothetical protein